MVFVCVVKTCVNSNVKSITKDCKLHKFPNDITLVHEWLKNCDRLDLRFKSLEYLLANVRVCGKHFATKMFGNTKHTQLLPKAVPTEFNTIGVCFLCDKKLYGLSKRMCTSITKHSNIPYPEKIAELMGDEVVVIVTPADHICMNCTSLLTQIDELENDMKLVKNSILSIIQKKYGILPNDQAVQIVNGHIKAEEQLEKVQRKVPSGLTVGVSPTITTAAVVAPVHTPLKLLTAQQQQQQQQQQQENTNKTKIYKCGFCTFKTKELGHVRFHMRTHMNKKKPEKPIHNQAAVKALTLVSQQKKRLYRCQICSKCFDSQIYCLDHIHKNHNQQTPSTSNKERETEDSRPVTTKTMKQKPSKSQENNRQVESPIDVDKNQQDNNKGAVDKDMILNDNVTTKGSANVEREERTENAGKGKKRYSRA